MKPTLIHALALTLLVAGPAAALPAQVINQTTQVTGIQEQGPATGPLSISAPIDGSTVGSASIDVRGNLLRPFNQPGTQVSVNGQSATVESFGSGRARFVLANLELTPGLNGLVIEATTPGGDSRRLDAAVTFSPLTGNNVIVRGRFAYVARGVAGLGIMDLRTRIGTTMAPPAGSNRVDDVATADGFLFLLDAANGGRLSVMDLEDPVEPAIIGTPVSVPVGPFAGVSAAGGRVVVSGGTSLMTVRNYGADGQLSTAVSSIDLGVGQPDVTVSADGASAFVSTDFAGLVNGSPFGLTTVTLADAPAPLSIFSRTGLPGAGFTAGFQAPANFPIASALFQGDVMVAHGGGLTRVNAQGVVQGTRPLGFAGVNVGVFGSTAFVVGSGRNLATLDLSAPGAPTLISSSQLNGTGALTGVAANARFVAIASNGGGLRVMSR